MGGCHINAMNVFGVARLTGPTIKVTFAPRFAKASAIAKPILPEL